MNELQALQAKVKETKFTVSNSKIKQTERNQLKSDALDAMSIDLTSGLEVVGRCKEGVIVAFDNDEEGAIYGVVDIVIKNLDYEPESYLEDYRIAQEEKAERERKRAEKRNKAKASQ